MHGQFQSKLLKYIKHAERRLKKLFTVTVIVQGWAAMQRNAREHQPNRQAAPLAEPGANVVANYQQAQRSELL